MHMYILYSQSCLYDVCSVPLRSEDEVTRRKLLSSSRERSISTPNVLFTSEQRERSSSEVRDTCMSTLYLDNLASIVCFDL